MIFLKLRQRTTTTVAWNTNIVSTKNTTKVLLSQIKASFILYSALTAKTKTLPWQLNFPKTQNRRQQVFFLLWTNETETLQTRRTRKINVTQICDILWLKRMAKQRHAICKKERNMLRDERSNINRHPYKYNYLTKN